MTLAAVMILASTAVVCGVCVYLALHRDYHSGFIGSIGLGLIAVAAAARFSFVVERCLDSGCSARFGPVALVWLGLALYMGRIAWKFYRRLKRRGTPGWYERGEA